jgi:hypothetical protein
VTPAAFSAIVNAGMKELRRQRDEGSAHAAIEDPEVIIWDGEFDLNRLTRTIIDALVAYMKETNP